MAFHQQATDELGSDLLGGAGEEGREQVREGAGGDGRELTNCCRMLAGEQKCIIAGNKVCRLCAVSKDQLQALLAQLKEDVGLQEKLKSAADLDAAVVIAHETGFEITKEGVERCRSALTALAADHPS
ncbi:MAG: Nif11-like leader peptide family natural product precursor [Cyanobacteria bacterium]|nr:Nif11-like leader peptide family natural product precursor [Cyanobacteriota bacterium]